MKVRFSDGTVYEAESVERIERDGKVFTILVNPVLPADFYNDEAGKYEDERSKWYAFPYIERHPATDTQAEGFTVWCRDGGCWDRPTLWFSCSELAAAVDAVVMGRDYCRNRLQHG